MAPLGKPLSSGRTYTIALGGSTTPMPHGTGVQMQVVGPPVGADATALQAHGQRAQVLERDLLDADVDRLADQVVAVLGVAPALAPALLVGLGRPVAGE